MSRYDLWKESGPVDALTAAELEAERIEAGKPVEDEGPNPDDAYDRMRLGE